MEKDKITNKKRLENKLVFYRFTIFMHHFVPYQFALLIFSSLFLILRHFLFLIPYSPFLIPYPLFFSIPYSLSLVILPSLFLILSYFSYVFALCPLFKIPCPSFAVFLPELCCVPDIWTAEGGVVRGPTLVKQERPTPTPTPAGTPTTTPSTTPAPMLAHPALPSILAPIQQVPLDLVIALQPQSVLFSVFYD